MHTDTSKLKAISQLAAGSTERILRMTKNINMENTIVTTAIISGGLALAGSSVNSWEVAQGLIKAVPPNLNKDGLPVYNLVTYFKDIAFTHESLGYQLYDAGMLGTLTPVVVQSLKSVSEVTYRLLPQIKTRNIERYSAQMFEYVQRVDPPTRDTNKKVLLQSFEKLREEMNDSGLTENEQVEALHDSYRKLSM